MRSSEQISRTVTAYHEWQQRERARYLREVLAMLRRARDEGAEWYRWIEQGRPELTREQYASLTTARGRRRGRG